MSDGPPTIPEMKLTPEEQHDLLEENARLCADARVLRRQLERSLHDERQMHETLGAAQARCTELLELNRQLDQRARVREFMERSEQPRYPVPGHIPEGLLGFRLDLLMEEVMELLVACGVCEEAVADMLLAWNAQRANFGAPTDLATYVDLVDAVDALADIAYVVEGFYQTLGVDSAPVAAEVHRSNWEKVCDGVKRNPETGKVMKPDGWKPPQIAEELRRQGWKGDD